MGSKPKVLILTDWFVPGFKAGGPIQSVNNLVKALESKLDFSVITSDRDLLEKQAYPVIKSDLWLRSSDHRIYYASPEGLSSILKHELTGASHDWIYTNSFFSWRFTIKPLLLLWRHHALHKVILAPRGMLGAGALSVKPFKKKMFIQLFRLLGITKRIQFHATDASEAIAIQNAIGSEARITVISNFPVQISNQEKPGSARNPVKLVYASRLSPKKNPLYLLKILQDIKGLNYRLDLYGTVDDHAYFEKCQKLIEANDRMHWHPAVSPTELYAILRQADFFVLPTLNENFGHAIIEALAHGTPVIISDQTPWNDLESFGAGWVIPLSDATTWKKTLEQTAQLSERDYKRMSASAVEYVKRKFDFEEIRTQYLELFP